MKVRFHPLAAAAHAGALCALLAGCATAPSPPPASADARATGWLRGADCLDPAMARSWIELDHDELLVDAGRHKYLIEVSGACTSIGWSQLLVFRGDPVSGRVCGSPGDAILTRDYPCTIQGMRLLDKEQYKALLKQREESRGRKPAAGR